MKVKFGMEVHVMDKSIQQHKIHQAVMLISQIIQVYMMVVLPELALSLLLTLTQVQILPVLDPSICITFQIFTPEFTKIMF